MFSDGIYLQRMVSHLSPRLKTMYEGMMEVEFKIAIIEKALKRGVVPIYAFQSILTITDSLISDTLAIVKRNTNNSKVVKIAEKQFGLLRKDIHKVLDEMRQLKVLGSDVIIAQTALYLPKIQEFFNLYLRPIFLGMAKTMALSPDTIWGEVEGNFSHEVLDRLGLIPEEVSGEELIERRRRKRRRK